MRKIIFALVMTLALLSTFTIGASAHSAHKVASTYVTESRTTVHMWIVRHTGDTAAPDTTVPGDCGNITLIIRNLGQGDAQFYYKVDSSQGAILSITYNVSWSNPGHGGNSFGTTVPFPGNPWQDSTNQYTQPGKVEGTLTATDTVGFFNQCAGTVSTEGTITS